MDALFKSSECDGAANRAFRTAADGRLIASVIQECMILYNIPAAHRFAATPPASATSPCVVR